MINWFQVSVAAVVTFVVCFGLHTLRVNSIEGKHTKAIADQKLQLENAFLSSQLFTYGVSDAYQKNLAADNAAIDNHFNSIVMRGENSTACIAVSKPVSGLDAARATGTVSNAGNGVPAVAILGVARRADLRYKRAAGKLLACQTHAAEIERRKRAQ